ncbi:MAG: M23 family metallopeptidase [Thermoanaerobaculia bacterium]|jgi:murein DD-endopeptidase MepM/ murein hydrolase activator NlpD|nr:M23 family metallopeptidase [Thermoanaerobaculia bacterium]
MVTRVKPAARPANLIRILLGCALLLPLTWWFVRAERDVLPEAPAAAPVRRAVRPAAKAATGKPAGSTESPSTGEEDRASAPRELAVPVAGVDPRSLEGTFSQRRGGSRSHDALDILAPRGTPVVAADDGVVKKLFTSVRGGLTVYQFDPNEQYCYYYAHLDGYAPGLHEGQVLRKGDLVGFVGSTGNARKDAPHLHFAVNCLDPDKKWWGGTPIDPYPLLVRAP